MRLQVLRLRLLLGLGLGLLLLAEQLQALQPPADWIINLTGLRVKHFKGPHKAGVYPLGLCTQLKHLTRVVGRVKASWLHRQAI